MKYQNILKYTLSIVLIILIGRLTEKNILFSRFNQHYASHFQKVYRAKEKTLQNTINLLVKTLPDQTTDSLTQYTFNHVTLSLNSQGMAAFIYVHDTLKCWSDNEVVVAPLFSQTGIDSTFIYLRNAWYTPYVQKSKNLIVVGLIRIKYVYPYENKFLINHFQKDFDCPVSVKISHQPVPNSFPILNNHQQVVFSLIYDTSAYYDFYQSYIPSACYFAAFLVLLLFLYRLIHHLPNPRIKSYGFLILAVLILPLRLYLHASLAGCFCMLIYSSLSILLARIFYHPWEIC